MNNLLTLKKDIKTEAKRLGFTHMGIAPAKTVPHYDRYLDWIRSGKHADMTYLSREAATAKRGNPQLILEGCQRIICLTMPYQPPQSKPGETLSGKGRVSSYAITKDYHATILEKLLKLEEFIHSHTYQKVRIKSYVDTGPVLERAYAALAGMGMPGKNGCLLIQGSGSHFFLAEILTDLALPIDAPYPHDLCKSCRRCIDACPTSCILENRTIDANRCISYLTIENKGEIPDHLKSKLGDWVFGCDICQTVCPHNAHTPEQLYALGAPLIQEWINLLDLFALDEFTFKKKFGETPLSRAKRQGLLRNAAIVLGNQKLKAALPVLQQALEKEQDPAVIDACRWAIKMIEHDSQADTQEIQSQV